MEFEKRLLTKTLEKHGGIINIPDRSVLEVLKDPLRSKAVRDAGTSLYLKKGHDNATHARIFSCYSQSIALAPNPSEELALAYGNRSAFLFHIKRYENCILDIDRALACTNSKPLKIKLLCRKIQCLKALRTYDDSELLETAQGFLGDMDDEDSAKDSLSRLVRQTENLKAREESDSSDSEDETESKIFQERLSLKETESPLESVSIGHSVKYGRCLIATRNFKPGDIIIVQKMYAAILDSKKWYTNCSYCFQTAWSGIPCDHCNWAMFCSQNCKEKAWTEFHDIECEIVPLSDMSGFDDVSIDYSPHTHLSIRLLIMAVKESRGLEKLKNAVKAIDETEDPRQKGFFQDEQFSGNSFRAVYSLKSTMLCETTLEEMSIHACRSLLLIAKRTSFLGENERINNVQDLLKNDTAMFVGSLILKLMQITKINGYAYRGIDYPFHEPSDTHEDFNSKVGMGISPLCSLINHSCYPNVRRIFTRDRKVIILCVLPIKKNDQIFDTYHGCFYEESKSDRLGYLKEYEFDCDCQACREDWPHMLEMAKEEGKSRKKSYSEELCEVSCIRMGESFKEKKSKLDRKTVSFFSKYITKAAEKQELSSSTCYAMFTFYEMFKAFYSFRRESFGDCL